MFGSGRATSRVIIIAGTATTVNSLYFTTSVCLAVMSWMSSCADLGGQWHGTLVSPGRVKD